MKSRSALLFVFFKTESEAFVVEESGAEQKEEEEEEEEGGCSACRGGLTLHPLLALALLFVLLLEFGYQAGVHVPGLRDGALLVLLYTGQQSDASGQRQPVTAAGKSHNRRHFVGNFFFFFCERDASKYQ